MSATAREGALSAQTYPTSAPHQGRMKVATKELLRKRALQTL